MAPPNDQQATNIQSNTNANAAFSNVLLIFSSWLMKVQKWTTSNKKLFIRILITARTGFPLNLYSMRMVIALHTIRFGFLFCESYMIEKAALLCQKAKESILSWFYSGFCQCRKLC